MYFWGKTSQINMQPQRVPSLAPSAKNRTEQKRPSGGLRGLGRSDKLSKLRDMSSSEAPTDH